jgi:hypothetical protein
VSCRCLNRVSSVSAHTSVPSEEGMTYRLVGLEDSVSDFAMGFGVGV